LINNRQGGRRRGRGGGGRAPNNAPTGNRQENRQRGNAAQLLEKYKQLARDAQMQGDRVQSEYYHQFAEHYFRLLNENRARFEDHQRRHRDDEYGDEDEGEDDLVAADGDEASEDEGEGRRDFRQPREHREPREARDQREPREAREPRESREREPREMRRPRGEGDQRNGENRFEGRPRRPRRDMNGDGQSGEPAVNGQDDARINVDILPPAISAPVAAGDDAGEEAPRPRRRTRRPRGEDGEVAPAAA
jgi:hypothetical protein